MPLYTYKMQNDTGFAPNPFFGYMTLATCKPGIRRTKDKGQWVAGFTSKSLDGSMVGEEKLIFLMKIDQEKIPIPDYYGDTRFKNKIPVYNHAKPIFRAGDNIYMPLNGGGFSQIKNPNHWDTKKDCESIEDRDHDITGKYVLVSQEYWYFGSEPLTIDRKIRPNVPAKQSAYGRLTDNENLINEFIECVRSSSSGKRIIAKPHKWWDDPFDSWRSAD